MTDTATIERAIDLAIDSPTDAELPQPDPTRARLLRDFAEQFTTDGETPFVEFYDRFVASLGPEHDGKFGISVFRQHAAHIRILAGAKRDRCITRRLIDPLEVFARGHRKRGVLILITLPYRAFLESLPVGWRNEWSLSRFRVELAKHVRVVGNVVHDLDA